MMETNPEQHNEKVVHNYHDYANEVEEEGESAEEEHDMKDMKELTKSSMIHVEQNFPVQLHYMLSELEIDGMNDVVSWQPHGRCFLVHKPKQFVEQILGMWYRQTKLSSFQRQLNLYGFKRLTFGHDKGGYYHELFLRSKRFLSHRIQRSKVKGTGARKPSSPETEPNFYVAPFLSSTGLSSKEVQVSSMLASGPDMHLATGGPLSLQQLLTSTFAWSHLQQPNVASPPLFHTSANILMEARHAQQGQTYFQRLRKIPFPAEMQMVAGLGQYRVSGRQDDSTKARALALSCVEQDQAALDRSWSHWTGSLG